MTPSRSNRQATMARGRPRLEFTQLERLAEDHGAVLDATRSRVELDQPVADSLRAVAGVRIGGAVADDDGDRVGAGDGRRVPDEGGGLAPVATYRGQSGGRTDEEPVLRCAGAGRG